MILISNLPALKTRLSNFIDSSNGRVADTCFGIISERIQQPIYLELIWSYWHEESMMVQGVNTIARRFQNIKGEGAVDPQANLEVGPLRPLEQPDVGVHTGRATPPHRTSPCL